MTPGLHRKLEALAERHEEVGRLLADPAVLADNTRFRALSREYAPRPSTRATISRKPPCSPSFAETTSTFQRRRSA